MNTLTDQHTLKPNGSLITDFPDRRILLVDGDAQRSAAVARTLRPLAGQLACAKSLEGQPLDEFNLVTVCYDGLAEADRQKMLEHFSQVSAETHLLVISGEAAKRDYVPLFGRHALTNLLASNNGQVDEDELTVTVQKILRRDIFGIEKYFVWGVETVAVRVRHSSEKEDAVTFVEEYARSRGVHPRLVAQCCTVADEFITNAIYNAPVDAQGKPRFAHLARTEAISLADGEEVEIKLCRDGRRLGISASDCFGTLTESRLLDYLAKCFRRGENQVDRKEGGAGLGLYLAFEALSHFVVNIGHGRRTEMIGLIDTRGSYRDFAGRSKSFNVFTA